MGDQVDKVCKIGRGSGDLNWRGILRNVSMGSQKQRSCIPTIQFPQIGDGYPPDHIDICPRSPPLPLSLL